VGFKISVGYSTMTLHNYVRNLLGRSKMQFEDYQGRTLIYWNRD